MLYMNLGEGRVGTIDGRDVGLSPLVSSSNRSGLRARRTRRLGPSRSACRTLPRHSPRCLASPRPMSPCPRTRLATRCSASACRPGSLATSSTTAASTPRVGATSRPATSSGSLDASRARSNSSRLISPPLSAAPGFRPQIPRRQLMSNEFFALDKEGGDPIWYLQILMTIKASGDKTGGALGLPDFKTPAGQTPLHVHHKEDEGWYLLDGRVTCTCGDETTVIEPGGFIWLP